jgi:hypothetical protein
VRELDFEQGHAADFYYGDPGEDDDHGHFQGELEEVSDEDAPQAADECVNSCERDKEQDADEQGSVFGCAEGISGEVVAAEANGEDAALCDGVAEEDCRDADHRFDDPTEDEAVHEGAKVDCAETAEEGGGFALVAELDEFDVGEDFGAAPVAREEKDGHHAAKTLGPPEPVARDTVARDEAGDEKWRVGGKSSGDHGSASQPPGNVAAGDEKFLSAAGRAAAVIEADEEIEEQVGGDDDPIGGGEGHFSFCSASCANWWCFKRLSILLYSSERAN